ncbi:MAG: esterase family protein [Clostridiales bacterium]|nr:esterase family protein [Clostridiales bacterium]
MAIFDGNIFSETLGMTASLTVVLPERSPHVDSEGNMPVLTLLHGLSDNRSSWIRRTRVDLYAELAGLAVVVPEVQRSFYADMTYGLNYYTYIAEELPDICRRMFRLSAQRENNFVAGLSMGGYGALKLAFRHPERYAAAASFSGVANIQNRIAILPEREQIAVCNGKPADDCDLFELAKGLKDRGPVPRLYITCGSSDFMVEDNRDFHRHLESLNIAHTYEEWEGVHDWFFWDASIQKTIPFLLSGRDAG